MDARLHRDVARFAALTRPLLRTDPVRHTIALTTLARRLRTPDAAPAAGPGPADAPEPAALLTAHRDGELAGAALCMPPRDLVVSALPPTAAAAASEALVGLRIELPGAVGPRPEAEAFARSWMAHTGVAVRERMAQRLFSLHRLVVPVGVAGSARPVCSADIGLLAQWLADFAREATGGLRDPGSAAEQTRRSLAAGSSMLLWQVGHQPVAWASASSPVAAMSRIGPVYTPPQHRGHGYGSAVTAAAVQCVRRAGARHVVLFTDLANPVPNAIYPRLGFRPVHDTVELAFTA
ncbi:MAG TPA: GNAT family N-acetyltransferase [Pseudonocardiaceae bacterium]|jgi:GNAT superfamily N-acetyltransferase